MERNAELTESYAMPSGTQKYTTHKNTFEPHENEAERYCHCGHPCHCDKSCPICSCGHCSCYQRV
jgi:hypothetical protein